MKLLKCVSRAKKEAIQAVSKPGHVEATRLKLMKITRKGFMEDDMLSPFDNSISPNHPDFDYQRIRKRWDEMTMDGKLDARAARNRSHGKHPKGGFPEGSDGTTKKVHADLQSLKEQPEAGTGLYARFTRQAVDQMNGISDPITKASANFLFNPCSHATRTVKKGEYENDPEAMKAYWKEWNNLEKKETWRMCTLSEWSEVRDEAKKNGKECHLGYLFGFMAIKGDEFPPGDIRRKWKYRIVFQGNAVKDQDWEVALFQEMASTPTTLEAAKYCDFVGCCDAENATEGRDVEQAYLQATLKGPDTWIVLPKELWTPEMHKMKLPVVKLEKALYGHKKPGAFWQEFCDNACGKVGFKQFSENWPCVYWNDELKLMLTVYVDDLKLAGPKKNFKQAWAALGKTMSLEQPTGDTTEVSNYLGTEHIRGEKVVKGKTLQTLTWNVSHSIKRAISVYEEAVRSVTGRYPRMYPAELPILAEETKFADARKPNFDDGSTHFWECLSCRDTFPENQMKQTARFPVGTKRRVRDFYTPLEKPDFSSTCPPMGFGHGDGCLFSCRQRRGGVDDTDDESTDDDSDVELVSTSSGDEWDDLAAKVGFFDEEMLLERNVDPEDALERSVRGRLLKAQATKANRRTVPGAEATESPQGSESKTKSGGDPLWDPLRKGAGTQDELQKRKGVMQPYAAKILMTIMYSARAARFDLLKAVTFLAKYITRWDARCDQRLHRLMCFLFATKEDVMMGWIGDPVEELAPHIHFDSDFAGDPYTLKSTSGCHIDIQGPNSRFPLMGVSKGQSSTAQSSTEAEVASLDRGMKAHGEPMLAMMAVILKAFRTTPAAPGQRLVKIFIHEDNATCTRTCVTGKNLTMKTLERCFGVSVQYIHGRIESGDYVVVQTRSHDMQADIYTKGFNDKGYFLVFSIKDMECPPRVMAKTVVPEAELIRPETTSKFRLSQMSGKKMTSTGRLPLATLQEATVSALSVSEGLVLASHAMQIVIVISV